MSSDPPSRIPPRNQQPDNKSVRDELSSKNKVEKVREVDADEARKKKFKSFLDDEKPVSKENSKPSLFEISSNNANKERSFRQGRLPSPDFSNSQDKSSKPKEKEKEKDPLPHSDDFWEEIDVSSEKPPVKKEMKETVLPEEDALTSLGQLPRGSLVEGQKLSEEGKTAGLTARQIHPQEDVERPIRDDELLSKEEREVGLDSGSKNVSPRVAEKDKFRFSQADLNSFGEEESPISISLEGTVEKKEEKPSKEVDPKILEIAAGSRLPASVQPVAIAATEQAASYLHPVSTSLFFQMVGQIYVMNTSGVSRTEIVLNSPSFAGSRFFGATITIEKYTTAPDSFNIRLTGSEEAVTLFRQNTASLMSAFQNGNFAFKINRLDAEYTMEKPVFRRKEKEDRDSGSGDRRK
jgi:hypothetical protein